MAPITFGKCLSVLTWMACLSAYGGTADPGVSLSVLVPLKIVSPGAPQIPSEPSLGLPLRTFGEIPRVMSWDMAGILASPAILAPLPEPDTAELHKRMRRLLQHDLPPVLSQDPADEAKRHAPPPEQAHQMLSLGVLLVLLSLSLAWLVRERTPYSEPVPAERATVSLRVPALVFTPEPGYQSAVARSLIHLMQQCGSSGGSMAPPRVARPCDDNARGTSHATQSPVVSPHSVGPEFGSSGG